MSLKVRRKLVRPHNTTTCDILIKQGVNNSMTLDYLYSVQAQEIAYLASEKMKSLGGATRHHGFVASTMILEATRSKDECRIIESWLDIMLFTPYHR